MTDQFPSTLKDSTDLRRRLVVEVKRAQGLLADKDVRVDGKRLSPEEYRRWRSQLVATITTQEAQLVELNAHIDSLRSEMGRRKNGRTDRGPVGNALDLLRRLADEVTLTPEEERVVDDLEAHLGNGAGQLDLQKRVLELEAENQEQRVRIDRLDRENEQLCRELDDDLGC